MAFILFISFVILLRIGELRLSKRNEKWLLENGAVEYGKKHYPYLISFHILFIFSLIFEYIIRQPESFSLFLVFFYLLLVALKTWVMGSLGSYWHTRIYRVPNIPLIKTGAYAYFKHPNYLIVIAEIAVIPMVFNLYFTAAVFSIFNSIMLFIRIKEEDKALRI